MKTLGQLLYGEEGDAARRSKYEANVAARKSAKAKARAEADARGERGFIAQTLSDYNQSILNTVEFQGVKLREDTKTIIGPGGHSGPVNASTQVSVDTSGQIDRRATLTRVGAGAIFFGPAGAVVGGLAKKKLDSRKVYVTIVGDGYAWVIEADPKHEAKARQFAASINALAI